MRHLFMFMVILAAIATLLPGETLGVLDGIMKPSIIDIHGERLFVMDAEKIRVYSLKNLELLNSFGKKGEGPGEYKIVLNLPLRLQAYKDFLLVESIDKLLWFTPDGEYLREKRKSTLVGLITPIGKNYVARRLVQPQDGSLSTTAVKIYDQELKEVKELYRHKFIQQGAFPNLHLDMGKDFLTYQVADNKIFIEESKKGFVIEVFDFQGKKLYEINKPFEKIPFSGADKKQIVKDIEMDPQIQRQLTQFGFEWKDFAKNFHFDFPAHNPPINTMDIDNNKIYITTFKTKGDKVEYIIMDLKGKVLKKTFVPRTAKQWVMAVMMGVRLETIHNDKIYWIQENEDEDWQLHVQEIK